MPGERHPLPSISSQGKVEMLIQSFQRCKPPIPWWLSGRGQGDQQKLGLGAALGSWASLPSKTAQANSSLFTVGRGNRGINPRGLSPQILPCPPGDRRDLVFGSVLMLQPVAAVPCVAGRMQVLHRGSALHQLLFCPSRR